MKKLWSPLIIVLALFATHAIAEESNPEALDSDISFVLTKGLWEVGEKNGRYRLVVKNLGWEHARSFVYLQWVYLDQKAEKSVVISSVSIGEFNKKDWRHFNSATYDKNKFILNYTNRGRGTAQKAILIPGEPGNYHIDIKDELF